MADLPGHGPRASKASGGNNRWSCAATRARDQYFAHCQYTDTGEWLRNGTAEEVAALPGASSRRPAETAHEGASTSSRRVVASSSSAPAAMRFLKTVVGSASKGAQQSAQEVAELLDQQFFVTIKSWREVLNFLYRENGGTCQKCGDRPEGDINCAAGGPQQQQVQGGSRDDCDLELEFIPDLVLSPYPKLYDDIARADFERILEDVKGQMQFRANLLRTLRGIQHALAADQESRHQRAPAHEQQQGAPRVDHPGEFSDNLSGTSIEWSSPPGAVGAVGDRNSLQSPDNRTPSQEEHPKTEDISYELPASPNMKEEQLRKIQAACEGLRPKIPPAFFTEKQFFWDFLLGRRNFFLAYFNLRDVADAIQTTSFAPKVAPVLLEMFGSIGKATLGGGESSGVPSSLGAATHADPSRGSTPGVHQSGGSTGSTETASTAAASQHSTTTTFSSTRRRQSMPSSGVETFYQTPFTSQSQQQFVRRRLTNNVFQVLAKSDGAYLRYYDAVTATKRVAAHCLLPRSASKGASSSGSTIPTELLSLPHWCSSQGSTKEVDENNERQHVLEKEVVLSCFERWRELFSAMLLGGAEADHEQEEDQSQQHNTNAGQPPQEVHGAQRTAPTQAESLRMQRLLPRLPGVVDVGSSAAELPQARPRHQTRHDDQEQQDDEGDHNAFQNQNEGVFMYRNLILNDRQREEQDVRELLAEQLSAQLDELHLTDDEEEDHDPADVAHHLDAFDVLTDRTRNENAGRSRGHPPPQIPRTTRMTSTATVPPFLTTEGNGVTPIPGSQFVFRGGGLNISNPRRIPPNQADQRPFASRSARTRSLLLPSPQASFFLSAPMVSLVLRRVVLPYLEFLSTFAVVSRTGNNNSTSAQKFLRVAEPLNSDALTEKVSAITSFLTSCLQYTGELYQELSVDVIRSEEEARAAVRRPSGILRVFYLRSFPFLNTDREYVRLFREVATIVRHAEMPEETDPAPKQHGAPDQMRGTTAAASASSSSGEGDSFPAYHTGGTQHRDDEEINAETRVLHERGRPQQHDLVRNEEPPFSLPLRQRFGAGRPEPFSVGSPERSWRNSDFLLERRRVVSAAVSTGTTREERPRASPPVSASRQSASGQEPGAGTNIAGGGTATGSGTTRRAARMSPTWESTGPEEFTSRTGRRSSVFPSFIAGISGSRNAAGAAAPSTAGPAHQALQAPTASRTTTVVQRDFEILCEDIVRSFVFLGQKFPHTRDIVNLRMTVLLLQIQAAARGDDGNPGNEIWGREPFALFCNADQVLQATFLPV
ncbi:unnamed protein product [Amoebophrya sp. A120]|nr:unnamed protein product [Amoebophrya sp. A120]|eukprot:GSA120T00007791001.1